MSFLLGSAAQRAASPLGFQCSGSAEPPLRNSRPVAGNLRATRRAAQKGRGAILPQGSRQSKISILTVPSKKKGMTNRSCLPFWVSRAVGPLHPSAFQCSGRQSRPCAEVLPCSENARTAQRHRRPEGRLSGSSLLFQDFKILILTTLSIKKDICFTDVLVCGLRRPQDGSTLQDSNAIPPAPRPSDIEQHQGGLPFKSRKQGERDAECKAAFLKDWYNNSKKGAKGGDGFGAFDFMVGWTRG